MKKQDYNATIVVKSTPAEAFKQINRVSAWWTDSVKGHSEDLGDVFSVHFGDTFVNFKIVESVPGKKVVWLVTDCHIPWLKDIKEWKDTMVSFDISGEKGETKINFTHIGLVPEVECYANCERGWNQYVKESLFKLLTEGKGAPQKKAAETAAAAQ